MTTNISCVARWLTRSCSRSELGVSLASLISIFRVPDISGTLESLQVDGFGEACFDGTLFERLVLKDSTKELIKTLTQMYIRDGAVSGTGEENQFTSITRAHKTPKQQTPTPHAWSADFIEGKGEGLTILLHGKPGVGKTYTAGECVLVAFCRHHI